MARGLNMVFLVVLAVTALIQSSVAQTTFQVGDALGWTIPPNTAAYSTWASNKTFTLNDILVFNFTTGQHDVARVSKANYDSCNPANPISIQNNGPATLTLNETGAHYYICTISSHCSLGQKLAINVTTTTSPAPQPSTSPTATPTPAPTVAPAPVPPTTATPPSSTTSPPPTTATPPSSTTSPPPPTTATPPSSTTTPSAPTPTGVSAPPPPPSSATSLGVTGLCATFLSIVIALLY
uniref:Phytocyanin domain-containing protein n=1 Tax=Fagus sylvatica TaxID=28930 RepID=A0A2N9ITF8_FAGSY